jgi:succinate dehydrogenase hydrophobic anchor subunit
MGGIPGMQTGIAIIYIVMALLYFFPIYYLYKYASDMKNALNQKDNELLTNSLGHLKSHHKFLGVSIIVIMSLYALFIIGMIIFGLGSRF